jgi:hypothetical protein
VAVESVQFAFFLSTPTGTKSAVEAARDLFPNRFPNAFNEVGPGQSVASFTDPAHHITVASVPGRHDLVIQRNTGERPPGSLPVDTDFVQNEYLPILGSFAQKVFAARLAIVIKANKPAKTRAEAVSYFQQAVPGVLVPSGTTEVDFKVNVPRQLRASPGREMNRLHRWYTAGLTFVIVGPSMNRTGETKWFLYDEMDVSTSTEENIELGKAQIIFNELYAEACYHIDKGPDSFESLLNEF